MISSKFILIHFGIRFLIISNLNICCSSNFIFIWAGIRILICIIFNLNICLHVWLHHFSFTIWFRFFIGIIGKLNIFLSLFTNFIFIWAWIRVLIISNLDIHIWLNHFCFSIWIRVFIFILDLNKTFFRYFLWNFFLFRSNFFKFWCWYRCSFVKGAPVWRSFLCSSFWFCGVCLNFFGILCFFFDWT